jgi:O-antigen ligase
MNDFIKKLHAISFMLIGVSIPISIAATNIFIGLFVVCWIKEGNIREKLEKIKKTKWMISILSLLILYSLAMMWGNEHSNAKGTFQILSLFLTFIVFETSKLNQSTLKWGALLFLFATFISAILAILINQEIILPLHNYTSMISPDVTKTVFIWYTYHNILLAFSSLLCFFLLAEKKSKHRWLLIIFILVYSLSILTERGRAGQLIFFLIFGIYAVYYFKRKIIYSIAIISFLISCCYISYQYSYWFSHRFNTTMTVIQDEINGDEEDIRFFFFRKSLEYIKKKPILGYGTGSFAKTLNVRINEKFPKLYTTPHNTYLYVLFETGIFGLIILLSIFYFQIKSLYRLKYNFHRVLLPFGLMVIMFFDAYLFSFVVTIFYIYFFTIYNNYKFQETSK